MVANNTTVAHQSTMYDRLKQLADAASLTFTEVSTLSGVPYGTIRHLKFRAHKEGAQAEWNNATLTALSTTLATKLNRRPSEVYGHLAGIELIDLSTSPSRSARGRRSAPAQ